MTETSEDRRDFLLVATATVGATGLAISAWPFIDTMNPSADVRALANTEVDLSPIETGQRITVIWQGKPVFVAHRSDEEINMIRSEEALDLRDPQKDEERVQQADWLLVVGICTHLGCIPFGQKNGDPVGEYGGWFCPCHGSHYDASGRIRKGPAPRNLDVPPYDIRNDGTVLIG